MPLASVLRWSWRSCGCSRRTASILRSRCPWPRTPASRQFRLPTSRCQSNGWPSTLTARPSTSASACAGIGSSATGCDTAIRRGAWRSCGRGILRKDGGLWSSFGKYEPKSLSRRIRGIGPRIPSMLRRIARKWVTKMQHTDRQRGTLLGLAVGDALGAAIEFKRSGTFAEVTGYRGGGPHGLAPGEYGQTTLARHGRTSRRTGFLARLRRARKPVLRDLLSSRHWRNPWYRFSLAGSAWTRRMALAHK